MDFLINFLHVCNSVRQYHDITVKRRYQVPRKSISKIFFNTEICYHVVILSSIL